MLRATFYGVRGSTPCSCDQTRTFGGNTSCVLVDIDDEPPIIFDLGTGARYLGYDLMARASPGPGAPFRATALLSHLHWDHIQGTPFFKPLLMADSELVVVGPGQDGSSLEAELASFLRPPAFPIALAELPGSLRCREAVNETFPVGPVGITAFDVPHVGATNGYRVDGGGSSIAYISDHQQPLDGSLDLPDHVVEQCAGVDILIHDAQYDADEFAQRADWGHCTPDFALELALRCEARQLVLFHHDPTHDDEWIGAMVSRVQNVAGSALEVVGAREGLQITLD